MKEIYPINTINATEIFRTYNYSLKELYSKSETMKIEDLTKKAHFYFDLYYLFNYKKGTHLYRDRYKFWLTTTKFPLELAYKKTEMKRKQNYNRSQSLEPTKYLTSQKKAKDNSEKNFNSNPVIIIKKEKNLDENIVNENVKNVNQNENRRINIEMKNNLLNKKRKLEEKEKENKKETEESDEEYKDKLREMEEKQKEIEKIKEHLKKMKKKGKQTEVKLIRKNKENNISNMSLEESQKENINNQEIRGNQKTIAIKKDPNSNDDDNQLKPKATKKVEYILSPKNIKLNKNNLKEIQKKNKPKSISKMIKKEKENSYFDNNENLNNNENSNNNESRKEKDLLMNKEEEKEFKEFEMDLRDYLRRTISEERKYIFYANIIPESIHVILNLFKKNNKLQTNKVYPIYRNKKVELALFIEKEGKIKTIIKNI